MALGKNLKRAQLLPSSQPQEEEKKSQTEKKKRVVKPSNKGEDQTKNKSTSSKPKAIKSAAKKNIKKAESIVEIGEKVPLATTTVRLSEDEIKERESRRASYLYELKQIANQVTTWIVFDIRGVRFAIEIQKAQEVIRTPDITALPHTASHIKGVAQVRRRPILFIDFNIKFQLDPDDQERSDNFSLIIKPFKDWVGVLLKDVPQTIKIKGEQLVPVPPTINLIQGKESYIKYMYKHEEKVIYMVDIEGLILADQGVRNASQIHSNTIKS